MTTFADALIARGLSVKDNLNASTDPGVSNDSTQGYQVGSTWFNSVTGRVWKARNVSVAAAIWTPLASGVDPYIVNNWYLPDNVAVAPQGGVNPGVGSIRLFPGIIRHRMTIAQLGVRISTTNAGNVQAAIYANNPATGRPTGNALASTASMSTASAATVTADASVQVESGLYWFGTCLDNATATLATISNTIGVGMSRLIGSSTASNVMTTTACLTGVNVSGTFGTWPDLSSASFTENQGSSAYGAVQFKVGSIP